MIVYLMATLLACWCAWQATRRERKWIWYVAAAIPLTLVSAIRWDVGTDFYWTYFPALKAMECQALGGTDQLVDEFMAPLFDRLKGGPIDSVPALYVNYIRVLNNQEWGFRQLMELASWSGIGFRLITVVTSLMIGACVFVAVFRQSRNPVLAIYLYVTTSNYFLGLNVIRQYVAIGFALVAVEFIVRRKAVPFLAFLAAGMLFHKTVVLLAPCYLLRRFPIRPVIGFALVAAALAFSCVAEPVALWTMPKVGLGHYCRYFGPDSGWAKDGFEYFFFAINLCFMAFGGWYWKRAAEKDDYFAIWYGMTVIGTLFLALSGTLPLMKRINFYFSAPQFLLLPAILAAEERMRVRRVLTSLVLVGFALEMTVAVWVFNKNEVLPYIIKCHPQHAFQRVPFAAGPFKWQLPNR